MTLQSTKFTPLQCQLVRFCICAEFLNFLNTKLSEKSNFETPEGVPTKARAPSKICDYGIYGQLHSTLLINFVYKLRCFEGFLREKKNVQRALVF